MQQNDLKESKFQRNDSKRKIMEEFNKTKNSLERPILVDAELWKLLESNCSRQSISNHIAIKTNLLN